VDAGPPIPESHWTDDLGRFVFPDLGAGDYRLEARVEGMPPIRKDVRLTTEEDQVEVRLEAPAGTARTGSLVVQVVDPEGKPVAGVYILGLVEGAAPIQQRTGPDGRAELIDLSSPRIRLQITPPGSVSQPAPFLPHEPVDATVGGPPVVVRLAAAAFVRGRVVGPDGKPLSGMSVNAKGPGTAWAGARTDEKGEFSLSMEGGVPFRVEVGGSRTKDDGSGQVEMTNLRADPQELTAPADGILFTMHEIGSGRTLTVRVVDLDGKPIPFCSVSSPAPSKDGSLPWTDRDGRVTLEGLTEEECSITVHAPAGVVGGRPGIPEGTVMPPPVKVVPRGQEVVFQLRKGEARKGIVRDPDGRPVEKAWVILQTDDYVVSQGSSMPDGTFTVWVSPGRRLIRATASSISRDGPRFVADLEKDAVPQEGEIVLRLEPYKGR
jgi:protocatechuate 3,4-dioxygenase beta subunit